MANMQVAAQGAPVMDEAAMAEMRRLIFEAPIQELADAQGADWLCQCEYRRHRD